MQIFGCRNLRIARNSAMSACTRAARPAQYPAGCHTLQINSLAVCNPFRVQRWRETLTSLKDLQTAGLRPDSWSAHANRAWASVGDVNAE